MTIILSMPQTAISLATDATRGNVYKTTDGGKTWKTLPRPGEELVLEAGHAGPPVRNYYNLVIDPSSPFVPGKGHQRSTWPGRAGSLPAKTPVDRGFHWKISFPADYLNFRRPAVAAFRSLRRGLGAVAGRKNFDLLIAVHPHLVGKGKKLLGGVYVRRRQDLDRAQPGIGSQEGRP